MAGPFVYEGYRNPYVQSISSLMLEPGQIEAQRAQQVGNAQAAATLQRGAALGGAVQQIGAQVGGAIQQANDPAEKLKRMQLAQIETNQKSLSNANQIVSHLMQLDGTIDVGAATKMMTAANIGNDVQSDVLKHIDELHKITASYQQEKVNHQADLAHSAIGMIDSGIDPFLAVSATAGMAKTSQMVSDKDLGQLMAQIIQAPDKDAIRGVLSGVRGLSEKYKDVEKPVSVSEGGSLVNPATGKVVSSIAPKAVQPTTASLAYDLTNPDPVIRNRAATAMAAMKQGDIKPGTVEDWVSRARTMAAQAKGSALSDAEILKTDTAAIAQFKNLAKDPDMAALTQSNAELRNALLKVQLDQQPTKEDAAPIAQQILNHVLAPSQLQLFGGFGTAGAAFKRMVAEEAIKTDPQFNWEQAEADYQFSKNPAFQNTTRLMGSILESMPRILENAKALGNSDSQSINKAINEGKTEFNNVNLAKFKTDAMLVGDEIAKIMSGGGSGSGISDTKLKQAQSILTEAKDYKAMAGTLAEVNDLIGFRRKTLVRGTYMEREGQAAAGTTTGISSSKVPAGVTIQRGK